MSLLKGQMVQTEDNGASHDGRAAGLGDGILREMGQDLAAGVAHLDAEAAQAGVAPALETDGQRGA